MKINRRHVVEGGGGGAASHIRGDAYNKIALKYDK